jgi:hypothetical protein
VAVLEQHLQFTDADKSVKHAFLAVRQLGQATLENGAECIDVLRPRLNHQVLQVRFLEDQMQFGVVACVEEPKTLQVRPGDCALFQRNAARGQRNRAVGGCMSVQQSVDDTHEDGDDGEGDRVIEQAVRHAECDDDARDHVPADGPPVARGDGCGPSCKNFFCEGNGVHVNVCKNPFSIAEIAPFGTGWGLRECIDYCVLSIMSDE